MFAGALHGAVADLPSAVQVKEKVLVDDRHASGIPTSPVPVADSPYVSWPEKPWWEAPYEPYGHPAHSPGQPHSGPADPLDPLFGAIPGVYGTGAPGHEPFGHETWHHYESGGYGTALAWEAPGYQTDASDQWYGAQWVEPTGPAFPPQDFPPAPDSTNALGPYDAAELVDFHGSPDEEPPGQAPPHGETPVCHSAPEATSPTASPHRTTTRRADSRRRRAPRRGSAFLTVIAPSVAFMGMAGIAAASVGLGGSSGKAAQATPDPVVEPSAANAEFDTQLSTLSREADDFAGRASRTQERLDLEQRRREAQRARKAEAARKEALRPKFVLPVAQKGVGELFGAIGSMWSRRHTGLDFPVPMNTPVRAVTDGTVVAEWNPYYGNLVKVTAPDGTQTWYAHLASARIRSGFVKAGTVIAYAGSTGNSSGPHLHLEVHPGGGDAIDPLAWLRSHGLDPT